MYSCKKILSVAKMAKTVYETDNCLGATVTRSSVAAVQSCFCFIIVAAAIVLASQSCETLGELLHVTRLVGYLSYPTRARGKTVN